MRDRREALKLLAGGAAAAIGTSIITTSTAVADVGSASCYPSSWPTAIPNPRPANLTPARVGTGSNRYTTIAIQSSLSPFSHNCPAGYTTSREYLWSISGPAGTTPVLKTDAATPVAVPTTWNSAPTTVRAYDSSTATAHSNGIYTITVQYRVICTNGTRTCWRCATVGVTIDVSGSNATVNSRSFALTATDCPT